MAEVPGSGLEHRASPGATFLPAELGDVRLLIGSSSGEGLRLGIVVSRFHAEVTTRLVDGALGAARAAGVSDEDIVVVAVPGAFELAGAARCLVLSGRVDAIVCLGAVVRGETSHYDLVANEAAAGCARLSAETGIPLGFGVVTTEDLDQAFARAGGNLGNKGAEAVETALECAQLFGTLRGAQVGGTASGRSG